MLKELPIATNPGNNTYVNDFPINTSGSTSSVIDYLNNNIVNPNGSINSPGTENNPYVMPAVTTTAQSPNQIDFTIPIVIGILILLIATNT